MKKFLIFILFILFFFLLLGGALLYAFYPESKIPDGVVIDKILVLKSKRQMQVFAGGQLVKTYRVSLGRVPVGKKEYEGDRKTPEGIHTISHKNPHSKYHKTMCISYPDKRNIAHAKLLDKPPGGYVEIHGRPAEPDFTDRYAAHFDWTNGCVALTNKRLDDLYPHVPLGTVIEIRP